MATDGWELTLHQGGDWVWPLRDRKPGPSYAGRSAWWVDDRSR